jgi:hypothetical protein
MEVECLHVRVHTCILRHLRLWPPHNYHHNVSSSPKPRPRCPAVSPTHYSLPPFASLSLLSPNQGLGAAISAARTTVLTTVLLYYCTLTYAIISLHRQSMRHEPSWAQEADSPNHPQAHSCWQDSDYWMRPDICAEISNTSTY